MREKGREMVQDGGGSIRDAGEEHSKVCPGASWVRSTNSCKTKLNNTNKSKTVPRYTCKSKKQQKVRRKSLSLWSKLLAQLC